MVAANPHLSEFTHHPAATLPRPGDFTILQYMRPADPQSRHCPGTRRKLGRFARHSAAMFVAITVRPRQRGAAANEKAERSDGRTTASHTCVPGSTQECSRVAGTPPLSGPFAQATSAAVAPRSLHRTVRAVHIIQTILGGTTRQMSNDGTPMQSGIFDCLSSSVVIQAPSWVSSGTSPHTGQTCPPVTVRGTGKSSFATGVRIHW